MQIAQEQQYSPLEAKREGQQLQLILEQLISAFETFIESRDRTGKRKAQLKCQYAFVELGELLKESGVIEK